MEKLNFYKIGYKSIVGEYIVLKDPEKNLDERGYYCSWFQFLNKNLIEIEISSDEGFEYPDLIITRDIPFISEKMKDILEKNSIDYLFYKPIDFVDVYENKKTRYYLAVPERIDCLNYKKCNYDEENEIAENIIIDEEKIGTRDIFKLKGLGNNEIIITDKLYKILKEENLEGIYFRKIC